MFYLHAKLLITYWKEILSECKWADSFSKVYLIENHWSSNWCATTSTIPGVVPDQNLIESHHKTDVKAVLDRHDRRQQLGYFLTTTLPKVFKKVCFIFLNYLILN